MNITADGNYPLGVQANHASSIVIFGDFGGGSVQLGYKVGDAAVRAYADDNTAKTADGEWQLQHGKGAAVYLMVSGATAPDLTATAFRLS